MKYVGLLVFVGFATASMHAQFDAHDIHSFLWANYDEFAGKYPDATKGYTGIESPYALVGKVPLLFKSGKFDEIVALAPRIEKEFPEDIDMQLIVAQALAKVGKNKESDERFIQLANKFKTNQNVVFQTANIYVRRKEPENAIKVIDDLLNNSPKKPNNFVFHFLKAQIYIQLNQSEKALESVTASIDMHGGFDKGWLLFALLQEQKGKLDEAIKGYTHFLELTDTKNQSIEQHLLQLVFKQKMMQDKLATVSIDKSCFTNALSEFEKKDYEKALKQIDECLKAKPTDPQARLLKVQILSSLNRQAQAADDIKAWILEEPTNNEWYDALHLLCRTGLTYQKAIAVLEDVSKKHPQNILPILHCADLHMRVRNKDTAMTYHKKALNLASDATLKTKLLFNMGLLYYEQGKFNEMVTVLEQGRALNNNFPPLLNLLAYHYATKSNNLELAQELINLALKSDEKNCHYLDTQALIYYKQEKYPQALKLLKKIEKQSPDDFTILKHLGKTYYKLGKMDEARTTIKKALTTAHTDHEKSKAEFILSQWDSKRA